ncbi:MAG: neutral zinc metallopeptidase, partial [Alphaproteobacteria bacterium]
GGGGFGGFGGGRGGMGGFGGLAGGRGGLGIGAIIVLTLIGWALGIDPQALLSGADIVSSGGNQVAMQPAPHNAAPQDKAARFASAVLAETEDVWGTVLPAQAGIEYRRPHLVLFTEATQSGCGFAQAAMGPFYCPVDQKVYLDLSFFHDLEQRFHAGGDFANAYVIAHEVGHHVENMLGILEKAHAAERKMSQRDANAVSVRVELMADCLAGVWASQADQRWKVLEPGDVEEAMNAASAVGDDRLQQAAGRRVVPDSFTHGSAEQRVHWFMKGLKGGTINSCNTFAGKQV